MEKKLLNQMLLIVYFLLAGIQVPASDNQTNMVVMSLQLSEKQLAKLEKNSTKLRKNKLGGIEVYNKPSKTWLTLEGNLENVKNLEAFKKSAFVDNLIQTSACDSYAMLLVSLKNSTPDANLYVDNILLGNTSADGRLTRKAGAKCKKSTSILEMTKEGCNSKNTKIRIMKNPTKYRDAVVLSCGE